MAFVIVVKEEVRKCHQEACHGREHDGDGNDARLVAFVAEVGNEDDQSDLHDVVGAAQHAGLEGRQTEPFLESSEHDVVVDGQHEEGQAYESHVHYKQPQKASSFLLLLLVLIIDFGMVICLLALFRLCIPFSSVCPIFQATTFHCDVLSCCSNN